MFPYISELSPCFGNIRKHLTESSRLGQERLNVEVDIARTPFEYQYLEQYHGIPHPLYNTRIGNKLGLYNSNNQIVAESNDFYPNEESKEYVKDN